MNSKSAQDLACPVCGGHDIDMGLNEFRGVCSSCGFVLRDDGKIPSIDYPTTEKSHTSCKKDWLAECRVKNATEKQIAQAFAVLEDLGNQLELQTTWKKRAAELYCDAFKSEITDGRDTACVVAGCVRLSSLQDDHPIPTGRLTELDQIDKSQFRRSVKTLQRELDLELTPATPSEYVSFLQTEIDINRPKLQQLLKNTIGQEAFVGKDPAGIAAAGAYLLHGDCTQSEVAAAVGVSIETVRLRANQLRKFTNEE